MPVTEPSMVKSLLKSSLPKFSSPDSPSIDRMHWLPVPFSEVESLYDDEVLGTQRNHLRRVAFAAHVTRADIPLHSNYLAARLPSGALKLIDGYTRITAIKNGQRARPEQVWLGVVDADSPQAVDKLYLAVDSRKAVKTGRDAFEEGLRKAGLLDKLISPVFLQGYAVSAIIAAAGEGDIRSCVIAFKHGISVLDPLRLEVGRKALPSGAMAACLLLGQYEEDATAVQQFTAAVFKPEQLEPAQKRLVPGGVRFGLWLADRRAAGALSGKNVPVIMRQALGTYLWQRSGANGRVEPVSREDYLAQVKG